MQTHHLNFRLPLQFLVKGISFSFAPTACGGYILPTVWIMATICLAIQRDGFAQATPRARSVIVAENATKGLAIGN